MTAPHKTWTVLPHGNLTQINERIWIADGEINMPIGKFPRRMSVVRLNDNRLIIFSAVALDEANMAKLEALGQPAFIIVPSILHRLDAPAYANRYPSAQVFTPTAAREKVEDVVRVDTMTPDLADPSVRYLEVPGTSFNEAALEVTADDGLALIVNDIIGDIHDEHGLKGWLLKLLGFAGDEPHVPGPVKMGYKKHLDELAGQFREWADKPDLRRIIMSHGDIIETGPRAVLRQLADSLGYHGPP